MKKLLQIFVLFVLGISGLSAQNLDFTLRYSQADARYEVYVRPDASVANFFWGPSQITIVAPASVPDVQFNVTSVSAGAWLDNTRVFAPAAASSSDFHAVGSLGAPTLFTAGQETLVFHFTIPGQECVNGLRLYINGTDPDANAPGMLGGDYSNTVFGGPQGGNPAERYRMNYNNLGTACDCEEPITIACIADLNVTLGADCRARITPAMVLTGDYLCAADYEMRIDGQDTEFVSGCGAHTFESVHNKLHN